MKDGPSPDDATTKASFSSLLPGNGNVHGFEYLSVRETRDTEGGAGFGDADVWKMEPLRHDAATKDSTLQVKSGNAAANMVALSSLLAFVRDKRF